MTVKKDFFIENDSTGTVYYLSLIHISTMAVESPSLAARAAAV